MLKRLELLGFKSFADKTIFEFGAGITCIVGPNGSGKSNVVDAIKWVLGEQSAKSLRGKEMADVIFNGSATRRSLGVAEVTLVLDNAQRVLPVDAAEVQLTRRVYRSGEGEYLINKNPARLRDFRDMFMGTGAGTEAYSVIEQGKVDVLLQASTKERRLLFEEAAGISRFKARKVEALRKLEHVDQNLLRLHDIVEEVEKQLRSVKLQAAKARRYKEHTERLRDLRVKIGLADFHVFAGQLRELDERTTVLGQEVATQSKGCDSIDAKLIQVQSLLEELDNQVRSLEASLTDTRQEIGRLDSQAAYERAHARDLTGQIERLRGQWAEFFNRVAELERHIATISTEVARVEAACAASRAVVDAEAAELDQLRTEVASQQEAVAEAQTRYMDLVQTASGLRNELAAIDSQERTLRAQRQRLEGRCQTIEVPVRELTAEVAELAARETAADEIRAALRANLAELAGRDEQLRESHERITDALSELRERRSGAAARVDLLEDLESRQEGLSTGVQTALALPQLAENKLGLVADLIQVELDHAAAVEQALGDRAQSIVVRRQSDVIELLAQQTERFQGTVGFLPLDRIATVAAAPANEPPQLRQHAGFVARADELVRVPAGLDILAAHLLGQTVVVRDFPTALELAGQAGQFRFVTLAGDMVEPNGTISTGDSHATAGLVSRKSQLRALRDDIAALDGTIAGQDKSLDELAASIDQAEREQTALVDRLAMTGDELAQLRNRMTGRRQQLASLEEELQLNRSEMNDIDRDLTEVAAQRAVLRTRLAQTDGDAANSDNFVREQESVIGDKLADVEARQADLTASQIELAKTEGHLGGLRQRLGALTADLDERQRVQRETREQIDAAVEREQTCQRKILAASSQTSQRFLQKEKLSREIAALAGRRDNFRQQRQSLSADSQSSRERLQQLQAELHQRELETNDLRHQRTSLAERLLDDYEIDLATLYEGYQPDPSLERERAQQEITELRRKIAGLGNVNLEALAELQELETRSTTLHAQLDDLSQSKATLDEIIHKINQDSQKLFVETLDAIRSHFGELFRKLFGGGRADIVLENEADVLESGIEIVARPPGKELRSLSLLSGGEKTLTTVALLMSVFRAKPSPFCILDEVDAALDEANIERYTTLLREFSGQAQFIMITHSKKSMICADVLYGITMQESGISKRVSVCFEDVNEQGEINEAAIAREQSADAPPAESGQEAA